MTGLRAQICHPTHPMRLIRAQKIGQFDYVCRSHLRGLRFQRRAPFLQLLLQIELHPALTEQRKHHIARPSLRRFRVCGRRHSPLSQCFGLLLRNTHQPEPFDNMGATPSLRQTLRIFRIEPTLAQLQTPVHAHRRIARRFHPSDNLHRLHPFSHVLRVQIEVNVVEHRFPALTSMRKKRSDPFEVAHLKII